MSKRLIALIAGVLVVALMALGCGSDDEEASASSITKAQFIEQADAICKETEKQIQRDFGAYLESIESQGSAAVKDPDYGELVETVVTPNLEREIEEIQDLGAPSGDEEEIKAMLEARESDLVDAQAKPERLITDSETVFASSSKLAEAYGLENCAER